jgi:hypothetical protein
MKPSETRRRDEFFFQLTVQNRTPNSLPVASLETAVFGHCFILATNDLK